MATMMMDPKILKNHVENIRIYGDTVESDFVDSIKNHGVLEPLIVERDSKVILSGHRRRQGAIKAGLKQVPVILESVADPDEQLLRLLEGNRQREKTKEQKAREYKTLLEVEERLAKSRQKAAGGSKNGKTTGKKALGGNSPKRSPKSKESAASKVGMSAKTADQAAAVVDEIDAAEQAGDQARADDLRETLNTKSVAAASRRSRSGSRIVSQGEADEKNDAQRVATWLISELGKIEREFKRLVIQEDGNESNLHKIAHLRQNGQEFLTKLRNAKAVIQANKPHDLCVSCKGKGCKKCLQSGWMTKRQIEIHGGEN